jgi:putative acetyltransferase
MEITIRLARAADSAAARVVRSVYEEFEFTWEPDGYHSDLHDLGGRYLDRGDPFWVAEDARGDVIGTIGLRLFPPVPGALGTAVEVRGAVRLGGCDCSLDRLYVDPGARKLGAGSRLFETGIAEARRRGRRAIELWSDKRFADAHRLYARFGARPVAERICHDPDESAEWGLVLELGVPD